MLSVLFVIAWAFSQVSLAQAPAGILNKHFQANGQEQWNVIRTVTIEGKWVDAEYHGYPMKLTAKSPDKIRLEGIYQGQKYVEAYSGVIGWLIAPWKSRYEINRMDDQEELVIRNVFNFGSPLYQVRDHLEFTGLLDMEGVLYHTFTLVEGETKRIFYIDRDDHQLYYEQIEGQFGVEQVSLLKIYEKYKAYGPISIPTAVRIKGFDFDREFVFDEVLLGSGANNSTFEMPEGQ